ncbi:MAG: hypothetical protein R3C44_00580 [Chloroflexota bacterium]
MSKKILLIVSVLLVALIGVGLVAAQSELPGSGWKSGQQIQNIGSASATIVFDAYDTNGTPTNCGSQSAAPGASVNFLTDVNCSVPAGFVGSAVVSADQPIAAIVNVNNRGTSSAAGQYRGTDGSDVATTIAFPLVKNNFGGRTTTFYVQNASTSSNNISATFRVGTDTYPLNKTNVPGNAMVVLSPADAGVPSGAVGSLTVTGTQPLAGTSLEHEASAAVAQNLQASKAFTPSDYDSTAYCPLVRNAHTSNDQTTGIQAQNVSGAAQAVHVEYSYSIGNGSVQTASVDSPSLQPGESFTFFGGDATYGLPAGALGSATVSGMGGGDIAVVVNDRGFATSNPNRVTTYSCFPSSGATADVTLPLYKEFFGGNTSGIQIQNVGASPATVTVTYTPTGGGSAVVFTHSTPIAAGASATFYSVSTLASPAGISVVSGNAASLSNSYGGVTISSDQPIVAIANESSTPGGGSAASGQDTKNYEGFNQ